MKKSIEKTEKNRENIVDKAAFNMYYIQARFKSPMVSGRARGDLENDTGSDIRRNPDGRTTVNSNESETPEGLKGPEGFKRKEIRGIKHKSLILAQDERWRRA